MNAMLVLKERQQLAFKIDQSCSTSNNNKNHVDIVTTVVGVSEQEAIMQPCIEAGSKVFESY